MNEREWIQFQQEQLTQRVRMLRDYMNAIPEVTLRWDIAWHLGDCFEVVRRMSDPAEPQPDGSFRLPFTVEP